MYRMVIALALTCGLSSLAAHKVSVDFEHADNQFSCYKTYSWAGPPDVQSMNQLMAERVTGFVDEALAARHLRRVERGGDIVVHFQINVSEQERYFTYYNGAGFDWDWGGMTSTTVAEPLFMGTLTVDMIDAHRGQLVFQGVSTQSISSKPEKNTKKLAKAVNLIFEKYPPR